MMNENMAAVETPEEKREREMKEYRDSDKRAYLLTEWDRIGDQLCDYSGQYNVPKEKLVLMYQCCMQLADMDINVAAERMLEILLFTPKYAVNKQEKNRVCGTFSVRTIKDAVIIYALLDLFRKTLNPYIAYAIAVGIVNRAIPSAFSCFLSELTDNGSGLFNRCGKIETEELWLWYYKNKAGEVLNYKDNRYNYKETKVPIAAKVFLDYAIREEKDPDRQGMYINFKKFYYVDYLDVLNKYPRHLRKENKWEKKWSKYHFYRTRKGREKARIRLEALLTEDKICRTYLFACGKYLEWEWMRPRRNYKRILEFVEKVREFEPNHVFYLKMHDIVYDYKLIKVDQFLQVFSEFCRYSIFAIPMGVFFYAHGHGPLLITIMTGLGYMIPYCVKEAYELHLSNKRTRESERKRIEYGMVPEYGREKPFKNNSELKDEQESGADANDVIDAMIDGYLLSKFM